MTGPGDAALRVGWWARMPWWGQVLLVHALARGFSAAVLVVAARTQEANPWTSAAPSYLEYAGLMWDAGWYRQIAEDGYPEGLPTGADGEVVQNAWAFFPLFPVLGRVVGNALGVPWHVVGPLLATVLGVLAMLVLHQVVVAALDRPGSPADATQSRQVALLTVVVTTTAVASPVLQVAYTESLALLIVSAALWCLVRRHYGLAAPLLLMLGLTRAVALPMVVVVLLHLHSRWRGAQRGEERWTVAERAAGAGLVVVTVLAGLLWPAVVALRTGEVDAYTRTQAAWRGTGDVVPVDPWVEVATWSLGPWGPPVLVALIVLVVLVVLSPPLRRLGPELQGWAAGYLGYLLVVLEPGTSVIRFMLLAFPLAAGLALVVLRRQAHRWRCAALGVVIGAGLLAQMLWVWGLWRIVPPSGWPP